MNRPYLLNVAIATLCAFCYVTGCKSNAHFDQVVKIQNPNSTKTISSSISNKDINVIAQDSEGFVWIGTFRGLNRFDSRNYYQYFRGSDEGDLHNNQVYDLEALENGDMLVVAGSVSIYSAEDDNFHYFAQEDSIHFNRALKGNDGTFYVSDNFNLYKIDRSRDTIVLAMPTLSQSYSTFFMGEDNEVWRFSNRRLSRISLVSGEEVQYSLPFRPYFCAETNGGDLWLSDGSRMGVFNTVLRRYMDVPAAVAAAGKLASSPLNSVMSVGSDRILFNTVSGAYFLYDAQAETVIEGTSPSFPFELPPFKDTEGAFVDKDNNIWFYSNDQGIFISNPERSLFSEEQGSLHRLIDNTIVSIAYAKSCNTLIMASKQGGVYLWDRSNSRLTFLKNISESRLLMDMNDEWLWSVNSNGNKLQQWKVSPTSLTLIREYDSYSTLSIAQDSSGTIWLGCAYRYLQYLERGSHELKILPTSTETSKFFFTPTLLPLKDGQMMVASSIHYPIFVDENHQISSGRLNYDTFGKSLIANMFVPTGSIQDSDGFIWLGTVGSGLLRINPVTGEVIALDGEPCDDISGILEDDYGNIWVSTMNGIGRLDRKTLQFTNYSIEDGIGGNQFVDRSSCALPDGTLVFGGNHGITIFKPDEMRLVKTVPLCFERIMVNDGESPLNYDKNDNLVLTHRDKRFSVKYIALNFNEQQPVRYRYRLDGFDSDWHFVGMNMEANYNNLHPGKYTFRVAASTPSGSISTDELTLQLRVKPALWLSWWFILLEIIVLFFLSIWITRHYRHLRRIRETAERAESEEKFFTNIAHEFRSPLTMISGPLNMLEQMDNLNDEERKLLAMAQRSSRWMLQLVDQFLDVEKIKTDKLSLFVQKADISVLLKNICDIYENAASLKGVSFACEGLDLPFEMPLDVDKISKIMNNLLSNSLKFTPSGGMIRVSFDTIPDSYAEVTVTDTGIGIPDNLKEKIFDRYFQVEKNSNSHAIGSGIGLHYSRNLAKVHHGILWVEDNPAGKGSCFKLRIPYSDDAYAQDEWSRGPVVELNPNVPALEPLELTNNCREDKAAVLVVDDDIDIANYLKVILSDSYDVSCCYDADSAMKLLTEGNPPDLVISDVMMPQKDGFELCRAIRADVQLSHIPIILCTAKTSVEDKIHGLEEGANSYVTKPFDPKYLRAVVKSLLEIRNKVQKTITESTSVEAIDDEALPPQDKAFLERLFALIDESLSDSSLDVDMLAEKMGISRTKFYYKVKGLTGESPAVLLRNSRLNKSVSLIREGRYNLSEIADMVGFTSLSQFSVSFKKQFGVTPRDFR